MIKWIYYHVSLVRYHQNNQGASKKKKKNYFVVNKMGKRLEDGGGGRKDGLKNKKSLDESLKKKGEVIF